MALYRDVVTRNRPQLDTAQMDIEIADQVEPARLSPDQGRSDRNSDDISFGDDHESEDGVNLNEIVIIGAGDSIED